MGFSVSGAVAVVFIGLLVSAATLYPAVDRATERRADAVEARDERALERQNTAVSLVDATYNTSQETLTVTVRNTGASTLKVPAVDLLVDGEYATPPAANRSVEGDTATEVWAPGENLTLTRTEPSAPGQVLVATGPGVAVTGAVEVV
jgi:flagellar protein FlaF